MESRLDFYNILKFSIIPANLLLILVCVLSYFNMLPAFWNHPLYFFIFVIAIDTIFLALKIKNLPEYEREYSQIVYLSKYFFVLGLIVIAVNQFLKRQIIIDNMSYITIIVIALGFLAFYSSRKRVEKELEDEKTKEETDENRRKQEFDGKFKRLAKLNLNYGFKTVWRNYKGIKRIFSLILCIILMPFIFLIRLPYKIIKWMYKEGWGYSIILIIIMITFLFLRIYLIPHVAVDYDEGYTYAVNLGFLKYERLGTAGTGVTYSRTPIYNFFNSLVLFLTDDALLSLRLFNVIFFFAISPFIYITLRKLVNKKIALFSFFLINLNWYVNSIILAGRSYIFSVVFSFFALYFLINSLNIRNNKRHYSNLFFSLIFMILSFFEGHITATYHLVPLLFLILIFFFFNLNFKQKMIILLFGTIVLFVLLNYIFIINPSYGIFILNIFELDPSIFHIWNFASIFSYYSCIGLIIILLILSFFLFRFIIENVEKNKKTTLALFAFFIVYVYLIHSIFFSSATVYFYYFSDLVIPFIIIFSFWIIYLYCSLRKDWLRIITFIIFLFFFFTSSYNLYQIQQEKINYRFNGMPFNSFLKEIPAGSTILTDAPLITQILNNNVKTYSILIGKNFSEEVYSNLSQNTLDSSRNFSDLERERFAKEIKKTIDNYIVAPDQLYSLYSGNLLVMDQEQLIKIINSSQNREAYLILTHNAYEKKSETGNPELYQFLFTNMRIISIYEINNNLYNDRVVTGVQKKVLTLAKISLDNFSQNSQI